MIDQWPAVYVLPHGAAIAIGVENSGGGSQAYSSFWAVRHQVTLLASAFLQLWENLMITLGFWIRSLSC